MSDKELLEAAAKAAGIDTANQPYRDAICVRVGSLSWREWNPRADDGDALRLAVQLRFEIDICETGIAVRTPTGVKVLVSEKLEPDPYAATRLAITRAAAEIGKTTP